MNGRSPGAVRSRDEVADALGITGPGRRNTVAHIEKMAIRKLARGMEARGWSEEAIRAAIDGRESRRSSLERGDQAIPVSVISNEAGASW